MPTIDLTDKDRDLLTKILAQRANVQAKMAAALDAESASLASANQAIGRRAEADSAKYELSQLLTEFTDSTGVP